MIQQRTFITQIKWLINLKGLSGRIGEKRRVYSLMRKQIDERNQRHIKNGTALLKSALRLKQCLSYQELY